ncbi:MAG: ECF transporter S component [Clostridia bacterium]|nr:ECF transporter S component [Clostridia bacterium]MBQ8716571.1 ECF transporter S component [Clostridia bacterium]
MRSERKSSQNLRRMVMVAMFTAMSYVAMLFIHIKVGFLTMDIKDAVITLCGLFFGPVSALFISVLVPFIELLTMSDTGLYGLIMNIIGSAAFSVTVALFYKWKKTLWGAVAGLVSGALIMTAVMMLANLFITPYYMGTTMDAVRQMIPTLLLPFNLLKGVINVGAVLLLYKPLSRALHKMGILASKATRVPDEADFENGENSPRYGTKSAFNKTSIAVSIVAVLLIAASLVLIFTVLGGKFDFGL